MHEQIIFKHVSLPTRQHTKQIKHPGWEDFHFVKAIMRTPPQKHQPSRRTTFTCCDSQEGCVEQLGVCLHSASLSMHAASFGRQAKACHLFMSVCDLNLGFSTTDIKMQPPHMSYARETQKIQHLFAYRTFRKRENRLVWLS